MKARDSTDSPMHGGLGDVENGAIELGPPAEGEPQWGDDESHDGGSRGGGGSGGKEAGAVDGPAMSTRAASLQVVLFCRSVLAESPPDWWLRCWSACSPSKAVERSGAGGEWGADGGVGSIGGGGGDSSGGVPWWSPAGLWFVFVRIAMVTSFALSTQYLLKRAVPHYPVYAWTYSVPLILATLTTLFTASSFLPGKFREAIDNAGARLLKAEDYEEAAHLSCYFTAFWLVWGVIASAVNNAVGDDLQDDFGNDDAYDTYWYVFYILGSCATTPTLGAVLFALSLDVARARKHVESLAEGARNETLTIREYRRASEAIRAINESWQVHLWWLAGAAAYNLVGMLVYMAHNATARSSDDYVDDMTHRQFVEYTVVIDVLAFAAMGKETALFFLFASMARLVNDEADDVLTDVFQWRSDDHYRGEESGDDDTDDGDDNGGGGGGEIAALELQMRQVVRRVERVEKEKRRLGIIVEGADLSVLTARDPAWRRGMAHRLVAIRAGGIRFRVLGIRWTTTQVQALVASFVVTITGLLARRYSPR